ncbi:Diacylglycerol kinase [Planctomycetes bacterium Pla163]|uniref:Diacylglycerol kinase n=1 Tax=Rohdeia mirabilis TaxID=2528008 RepID=A0A518D361_9BACT|nr:Diacylglycerol kinase [Planctomycetes bacterium Pla163]
MNHAPLPYRRALVVANPIAGRGRAAAAARELTDGFTRCGLESEVHLTTARRDGWDRVHSMPDDVDLVVAVGGDGTLREILSGLVGRDVAVAQLPMGTANVLAKDARLPLDVDGLIELVRSGSTSILDTAEVNGELTFLCVGVGFDGACVAEVERRRKGPITKLDYVTAGLRVLASYRQPRLQLEVDGAPIDGDFGFVLVSNVREYGAVFGLSSLCRRDDQRAEVYAVRNASRFGLARMATTAILRELPGKAAEFWQAGHVRVRAADDVAWQIDGDLGGHGSVDYAFGGQRFRLVSP